MALIKGTKENYTHVRFNDYKNGTHTLIKHLFLKWKSEVLNPEYFIVNNK